jgi:hypothetical protein
MDRVIWQNEIAMKESQIPAERWIENLLWAAEQIADRGFQETRWLAPDAKAWESPDEAINSLDHFVLDGFAEQFADSLSPAQIKAVIEFRDEVDRYCGSTPRHLEPLNVLADPAWEVVRQRASEFVHAFKGKWPTPNG